MGIKDFMEKWNARGRRDGEMEEERKREMWWHGKVREVEDGNGRRLWEESEWHEGSMILSP